MNRNDFGFDKRWMAAVLYSVVLSACSQSGLEQPDAEADPERVVDAVLATEPEPVASAPDVADVAEAAEIDEQPARPLNLTLELDPSETVGSDQTLGDAQKFQKKVLPEMFDKQQADGALSVSGGLLHSPEYEMTQEEEGFVDSIKGAELTVTVKTR